MGGPLLLFSLVAAETRGGRRGGERGGANPPSPSPPPRQGASRRPRHHHEWPPARRVLRPCRRGGCGRRRAISSLAPLIGRGLLLDSSRLTTTSDVCGATPECATQAEPYGARTLWARTPWENHIIVLEPSHNSAPPQKSVASSTWREKLLLLLSYSSSPPPSSALPFSSPLSAKRRRRPGGEVGKMALGTVLPHL